MGQHQGEKKEDPKSRLAALICSSAFDKLDQINITLKIYFSQFKNVPDVFGNSLSIGNYMQISANPTKFSENFGET